MQENLTDIESDFDSPARSEMMKENLTKSKSNVDFQARRVSCKKIWLILSQILTFKLEGLVATKFDWHWVKFWLSSLMGNVQEILTHIRSTFDFQAIREMLQEILTDVESNFDF